MGDAACWSHLLCPACGAFTEAGDDPARHLLVLIGLMGVGKTTVGRRVAQRLGWAFVDNDELFEERTGTTAADYAAEQGDGAMHDLEWELLGEVLDGTEPAVLAAPGSVVGAPALDVTEAFVVWLQADPEVVADRLDGGDHRPLLGGEPGAVLARQLEERAARYRELADVTVAAAGRTPDEVAEQVVDAWCRRAGHR